MDKFKHIHPIGRRTMAAMVACVDDGVANVTKALKEAGMYDNSVIIVTTDNGE